jgi:hypothetical protein
MGAKDNGGKGELLKDPILGGSTTLQRGEQGLESLMALAMAGTGMTARAEAEYIPTLSHQLKRGASTHRNS